MTDCPFLDCDEEFIGTGSARNHLQLAHDVPCNRVTVWPILLAMNADIPDELEKAWKEYPIGDIWGDESER